MKQLLISVAIIFLITSCKKEGKEDVDISWVSIKQINDEIVCRFQVTVDDVVRVNVDAGIYWGTSPTPGVDGVKIDDYTPFSGELEIIINEFDYSSSYYFQAYCNYENESYFTNVWSISTEKGWKILPNSPSLEIRQLGISPAGVVHVIGNDGAHYHSTDDGANWIQVNHLDQANLSEIKFINDNTVYMMAGLSIRKSADGGMNWTDIPLPASTYPGAILFYDENSIFFSHNNLFYISHNSGATWSSVSTVIGTAQGIFFITDQIGFIVSWDGDIAKTTNGGLSWTTLTTSPLYGTGRDLWFLNENMGYVGMSEFIFSTSNGGSTWQSIFDGGNGSYINEIDFYDNQFGAISGASGVIALTEDGGQTWTLDFVPGDEENIIDIEFFDQSHGFAITTNGVIYKYY